MFTPAIRSKCKLRMALCGPSGAGKTYSALAVAAGMGKRIAVIDSEAASASKYAGENGWSFDVCVLDSVAPIAYVKAIQAADAAGYDVLVIDSLSHAWMGKDGALALVDQATARSKSGNAYVSWREVTPSHNALVDAILHSKCHVIATMRTHTEYSIEKVEKNGRLTTEIKKVGLAPLQRQGMEYEFDVVGDMSLEHRMVVSKSRCSAIDNAIFEKPGAELATALLQWLEAGVDAPERKEPPAVDVQPADKVSKEDWLELQDIVKSYGYTNAEVKAWLKNAKKTQTEREAWTAALYEFGSAKTDSTHGGTASTESTPTSAPAQSAATTADGQSAEKIAQTEPPSKAEQPVAGIVSPATPAVSAPPVDATRRYGQIMQAGRPNGWRSIDVQRWALTTFSLDDAKQLGSLSTQQFDQLEDHVTNNKPATV